MLEIEHRPLVILSSATYTRFGVFNHTERFIQTVNTCHSIRKRMPNAHIVLLEAGEQFLSEDEVDTLKTYNVEIEDYTNYSIVLNVIKIDNQDIVKNVIETAVFSHYYAKLMSQPMNQYTRIFKLSARYTLNEKFNYDDHLRSDKIVIRGPYTSQFKPETTGGTMFQYMARLYSFHPRFLAYILCVYENSMNHMIDRINSGGYIDIEHCLFKFINPNHIVSPNYIGVEGTIAPNGVRINE